MVVKNMKYLERIIPDRIILGKIFFLSTCIFFFITFTLNTHKRILIPTESLIIENSDEISETISKETEYIPKPAQGADLILIPAIVSNNGIACRILLIVDTGCSLTTLDKGLTTALQFKPTGKIGSINANGSQSVKETGSIDYIQIGPFREKNFLISNLAVLGNKKDDVAGFLGMNFLEKHPFTIDHDRHVIVWR